MAEIDEEIENDVAFKPSRRVSAKKKIVDTTPPLQEQPKDASPQDVVVAAQLTEPLAPDMEESQVEIMSPTPGSSAQDSVLLQVDQKLKEIATAAQRITADPLPSRDDIKAKAKEEREDNGRDGELMYYRELVNDLRMMIKSDRSTAGDIKDLVVTAKGILNQLKRGAY